LRRALISDIHGNLEALEAVLADIQTQDVQEVFCLGDVIGYGPNPCECIDLVMEHTRVCILGNHDQGALFDPDGFNIGAEKAIFWTREQLENPRDRTANEKRWDFLSTLPRTHRQGDFLFVHGSPRNPLAEYIFPEDIYNHRKMERQFQLVEKYCFQGHTHVPGVFTEGFQFYSPEDVGHEYTLGEGKVLVNVGSVGQPRDGDPRACYSILEDGLGPSGERVGAALLTFRRLPYDFETTIKKIYDVTELEPFLGDRLRQGR
jgi:diadenosine tetraphosphatase ApaH/serine/threonine PP2A family protein phosphatase